MQLKFFYTLSLLLCVVTFASSNECARFNCPATGKYKAACRASREAGRGSSDAVVAPGETTRAMVVPGVTSRETTTPACRKGEMTGCHEVENDESGMDTPLMRLLYI